MLAAKYRPLDPRKHTLLEAAGVQAHETNRGPGKETEQWDRNEKVSSSFWNSQSRPALEIRHTSSSAPCFCMELSWGCWGMLVSGGHPFPPLLCYPDFTTGVNR